jgi:hypothetical protein
MVLFSEFSSQACQKAHPCCISRRWKSCKLGASQQAAKRSPVDLIERNEGCSVCEPLQLRGLHSMRKVVFALAKLTVRNNGDMECAVWLLSVEKSPLD